MADLQPLFRTIDKLNTEELQQLSQYIAQKQSHLGVNEQTPMAKERILGLHEYLGHAWMSDDFNDELPDSFWLDQEV